MSTSAEYVVQTMTSGFHQTLHRSSGRVGETWYRNQACVSNDRAVDVRVVWNWCERHVVLLRFHPKLHFLLCFTFRFVCRRAPWMFLAYKTSRWLLSYCFAQSKWPLGIKCQHAQHPVNTVMFWVKQEQIPTSTIVYEVCISLSRRLLLILRFATAKVLCAEANVRYW